MGDTVAFALRDTGVDVVAEPNRPPSDGVHFFLKSVRGTNAGDGFEAGVKIADSAAANAASFA